MINQIRDMINSALAKKSMTQEQLAEKIGRSQALISRFIAGVPVAENTARAIAQALDLNADELIQQVQRYKLERRLKKIKAQYIPVVGENEIVDLISERKPLDVGYVSVINEIPLLDFYNQNTSQAERYIVPTGIDLDISKSFALRVKGQSMTDDKIDEGDIIIVDTKAKINHNDRVLTVRDGQQEIRRYQKAGDMILLQSNAVPEAPIVILPQDKSTKIIGRVIFLHKIF
ncbi:MAG: S24 family peptidase [Candidatus Poribacteria bacterium]